MAIVTVVVRVGEYHSVMLFKKGGYPAWESESEKRGRRLSSRKKKRRDEKQRLGLTSRTAVSHPS
jgi:hypothetical protein